METIINRNNSFISHQPTILTHRQVVWNYLRNNPNGLTCQEIADSSNKKLSLNTVRSRMTELQNDFLVKTVRSARNYMTGKVNSSFTLCSFNETYNSINRHIIHLSAEISLCKEDLKSGLSAASHDLIKKHINTSTRELQRFEDKLTKLKKDARFNSN
tara:strand:+ start:243 stop:716 length:474 start_codon:yes stop_codon:yes gene_type:complete